MTSSATIATLSAGPRRVGWWLPCRALWQREMVRFVRQRSRIVGALGTPLVFWLLAGGGLGRSFTPGDAGKSVSYLQYTFPGAIAAILLFTAIFSMISIIEDRREGFMQAVLVSPAPRLSIVLGKVFGASTLGVLQAAVFLVLGPLAGVPLDAAGVVLAFGAMILLALGVSGLGFVMAWLMESTQGFHAIMNLVLLPMLILSGAFFPLAGAAAPLRWIMTINPMTYGVALLRRALSAGPVAAAEFGAWPALVITLLFAVVTLAASVMVCTRPNAGRA